MTDDELEKEARRRLPEVWKVRNLVRDELDRHDAALRLTVLVSLMSEYLVLSAKNEKHLASGVRQAANDLQRCTLYMLEHKKQLTN